MARNINNQAIPVDVTKLVIGVMQCRVSSLTTLSSAVSQTGVTASTSTLSSSDSVGAIGEASFTGASTEKIFEAGFPALTYATVIEKNELTISVSLQEFYSSKTQPIIDAMLAGLNSSTQYACSVELVAEFVYGGTKSIWFPNCILVSQPEFNPGNDWAGFTVTFRAQPQTGAALGTELITIT